MDSSKRRGKPPKVDPKTIEDHFLKSIGELVIDRRLATSNQIIYLKIADELLMTKQAVYLAAKRFVKRSNLVDEVVEEEDDVDYLPAEYFGSGFAVSSSDIKFSINLGDVQLFNYDYEDTSDNKEWTCTLNEVIWEFGRLPCAWKFERMRNVCGEIIIFGQCKSIQCSHLFAFTEQCKQKLIFVVKNFNPNIEHYHKAFLKYSHKSKVESLLLSNKPTVVRAKLANSLMTDIDSYEPSLLPTNEALRTQKHRALKTKYLHDNPIMALRMMKESPKYYGCIGDIGLDPFYCVYSTPLQREILRVQTRYRRSVFSFDASGTNEKPSPLSSQRDFTEYKKTFLYVLTLHTEDFNVPVHQFMSQRQNSDFIAYKLDCFKYKCFSKKNPNEIIMDDSSALLLASVKSFTSCKTMEEYLNRCYDALFEHKPPPECYIRLDRAHFVKAILRMECLKADKRRKYFYQRIFGYLITVDDVDIVKEVIRLIFILLNNKYEMDRYVTEAKKQLKRMSDSHHMETDENEEATIVTTHKSSDDLFAGQSKVRAWIEENAQFVSENFVNDFLNNSSRDNNTSSDLIDNIHFAPHLQKPFIDFLVKVPLFSNIMNRSFKSKNSTATTAPTEAGFHVFKNIIFQQKCNTRLDVIVEQHLEYLQGHLKTLNTRKYHDNDCKGEENLNENDGNMHQAFEENWRNKNADAKPSKSTSQNRSKHSILDPVQPLCRNIPILRNGDRVIGTKNSTGILLTQTCPFDSLFQIYATCYADSPPFATLVNEDQSDLAQLIKNVFDPTYNPYSLRNKILLNLFPEKVLSYGRNIIAMDCEMGIHDMFSKVSTKFELIKSWRQFKQCNGCNYRSAKTGKLHFPLDLNNFNLHNIQDSLRVVNASSQCPVCGANAVAIIELNELVSFDVEVSEEDGHVKPINLNYISNEIQILGQKYALRGVVEYCPEMHHFRPNVRRNNGSWQCLDEMYPNGPKKPSKEVAAVMLVFMKLHTEIEASKGSASASPKVAPSIEVERMDIDHNDENDQPNSDIRPNAGQGSASTSPKVAPSNEVERMACPAATDIDHNDENDQPNSDIRPNAGQGNDFARATRKRKGNTEIRRSTRTNAGNNNSTTRQPSTNLSGEVMCANCHTPARRLMVTREGQNKEKYFYNCDECNFFKWESDVTSAASGASSSRNSNDPPRPRQKRKCGKCGQEGHTKVKCPSNNSS